MGKKIAVIGSSGGNLFGQGGKDADKLLAEIRTQADAAEMEIAYLQFVAAQATMDHVTPATQASLYTMEGSSISVLQEGSLYEINEGAMDVDEEIAQAILSEKVDGLILISCDPENVNHLAIAAAAKMKIPVVGTGGTSIASAKTMGANVISASGTTGTTNRTRAVAYISALSNEWGIRYSPIIGGSSIDVISSGMEGGNILKRINFRGIMMGAMPGFISMALILALSKIPGLGMLDEIFSLVIGVLPIIVAVLAAKQVSGLDEVGIVAGVVAGALSIDGGILGGIVGGILAGILSYYLILFCFKYKFPATTANIVAGGLAGLAAGMIVYFLLSPVAVFLGDGIRVLIERAVAFSPILAGALVGLLIWPAIIGGVYHAAILPIVFLEMELTGASFLGAIDMTGLVMVSAGITLANVVAPREKSEAAVALPGFLINMGFGTFVEASYPFMFSNKLVFAAALIASTVSGAAVGVFGIRGTAYVPSIVAPFMSSNPFAFILCMLIALVAAFVLTVTANQISRQSAKKV